MAAVRGRESTEPSNAPGDRAPRARQRRRLVDPYEAGMLLVIILVGLVFVILRSAFLSTSNLLAIVATTAVVGIMAVTSTWVMVAGGIDLSVGSIMALSCCVGALELQHLGSSFWWLTIITATAVGAGVGLCNGTAVVLLRAVPPFIITLGSLYIVAGVAIAVGGSYNLSILGPHDLLFIAQGDVGPVPVQAIIFLGLAVLFVFIERRTTLGRYVWAIGANPTAARIVGLPVDRVRLLTYIISGAGAGFAGYLSAIQVEAAASYYGQNAELSVITAILIGGTSMYGGEGSVVRSVLGAIVVGEVSDGLGVMNVNQNWQVIAMGALLIVAVTVSLTWRKKRAPGGGRLAPRDALLALRRDCPIF